MTDYVWPGFPLSRFQMRVGSLTKGFPSPYSNTIQTIDMLADCWFVQMDLTPDTLMAQGLAIEAFFDRLKGMANRIVLPNLRLRAPRGTMRGSPQLNTTAAQLSNQLSITTEPGVTLEPGDMVGAGGQLFRNLTHAQADGVGHMVIEVAPRVRPAAGIASSTPVIWDAPTAPFIVTSQNPAVDWRPGEFAAPSIELREDIR